MSDFKDTFKQQKHDHTNRNNNQKIRGKNLKTFTVKKF